MDSLKIMSMVWLGLERLDNIWHYHLHSLSMVQIKYFFTWKNCYTEKQKQREQRKPMKDSWKMKFRIKIKMLIMLDEKKAFWTHWTHHLPHAYYLHYHIIGFIVNLFIVINVQLMGKVKETLSDGKLFFRLNWT